MPDNGQPQAPYRVVLLDGATAEALTPMTFPAFRWLLPLASAAGPVFAFAITPPDARRVVGLALVRRESEAADLLSLFVWPTQRRRGLAHRLLDVAEETLARKGVAVLGAALTLATPGGDVMRRVLADRGWSEPVLRFLSFKSDFAHGKDAPWMRERPLPRGSRIVPWSSIGEGYLERIADLDHVPEDLHPQRYIPHAHDGAPLEPAGSFALLEGERLVGWILSHRINSHDARMSANYIHPRFEGRLASGPLWRIAILGLYQAGYRYGMWAVSARHPRFVAFARRHIAPLAITVNEVVQMTKRLQADMD